MSHHEEIRIAASQYGAVMFSGFEIKSGEEWASVLYKTGIKQMDYYYGVAVRKMIVGRDLHMKDIPVLTTNEAPPSEPIVFHHELAQSPHSPDHIMFYCQKNEAEGGSTPLIRSDFVYDWLKLNYPEFLKEVEEKGVKYFNIAAEKPDPNSGFGRSWKDLLKAKTKSEALNNAKKEGSTLEFLPGNFCKISTKAMPAVKTGTNGNKVFFNMIVAAYSGRFEKVNGHRKGVVFGDGTPLPDKVMLALIKFMDDHACIFKWTPGKFVIIDNSMTYHRRQAFKGAR